jgi:hypothetical protein
MYPWQSALTTARLPRRPIGRRLRWQEGHRVDTYSVSDPFDAFQREVVLAPFQAAQIGAMYADASSK